MTRQFGLSLVLIGSALALAPARAGDDAAQLKVDIAKLADRAEQPVVRLNACRAIAGRGPQAAAAVPVLRSMLQEPRSNYSFEVLNAVGAIGPKAKEAIPDLVAMLRFEPRTPGFDPDFQTAVVVAIEKVAPRADIVAPALTTAFEAALGDLDVVPYTQDVFCGAVVNCLFEVAPKNGPGTAKIIQLVSKYARSERAPHVPQENVRTTRVVSREDLAKKGINPAAYGMTEDVTAPNPHYPAQVEAEKAAMMQAHRSRMHAVQLLGEIGTPEAKDALRRLSRFDRDDIRIASKHVLDELK